MNFMTKLYHRIASFLDTGTVVKAEMPTVPEVYTTYARSKPFHIDVGDVPQEKVEAYLATVKAEVDTKQMPVAEPPVKAPRKKRAPAAAVVPVTPKQPAKKAAVKQAPKPAEK